jgi:hypothetical protein
LTHVVEICDGMLGDDAMSAMCVWLDKHRFEPNSFHYDISRRDPVLRVNFKVEAEAVAFAAAFRGQLIAPMHRAA